MENKNNKLLEVEEVEWTLKSREIWLREGDTNTKFFHKFANHRWSQNTIWSLKDENCRTLSSFKDLYDEAENHFRRIVKANNKGNIGEIVKAMNLYQPFLIVRTIILLMLL